MPYDTYLQAIAAKYAGEFSPDSYVWAQATLTTVDYTLSIPDNWIAYLLNVSGYASGTGVDVKFIDQDGFLRWEWTALKDTNTEYSVLPILEKAYTGSIIFRFYNSSSATRTIGWATIVLLIPESSRNDFENAVKAFADVPGLLKALLPTGQSAPIASTGGMDWPNVKPV